MYEPRNGFVEPPAWSSYSAELLERYRAAQVARVSRLDAVARAHLARHVAATEESEAPGFAARPFEERQAVLRRRASETVMVVHRTMADPACVDAALDPSPRDYGSLLSERLVCATVGDVQLEVTTASEPLYFNHINLSDEYAMALPTGDELVDRFPLRTFLSDPVTGEDVGRYNHRVGDLVLHPDGLLHWPGRLRPPYDPFELPPGMRRCGLSIVYCASKPTPPT